MKRKFFVTVMALVLGVSTLLSLVACGKSGGIVNDPKTLNVKIHSAGYGTTYIEEMKKEFEEIYSAEGYKINVMTPDASIANQLIYQEIYSDSGVDVYIATANAQASTNYIGQQSFADITETVVNKKPVGKNKVEGENTILSYLQGNENNDSYYYDGKYYGLPIAKSAGGLGVNKKILADEFNITAMPRTTKEFQTIIQKIMRKNANDIAGGASYAQVTHPFAYALSGNSYWMGLINTWFAQYSGVEAFDAFWSFENADGTPMTTDAYKVFDDDGLRIAIDLLYQVYDYNSAMSNVSQDNHLKAQHNVMQGFAVFCPTGDWMFNEEKKVYSDYLNDITFIKAPLVSELGVKLFGDSFSDDECEELLLKIVDGADANKTVEEIKATLAGTKFADVANEDILTVCERRGIYRDSSGTSCYISEKSTKKDIAALFLRYVASSDGAAVWSKEANTTSPYNVGGLDGNKYDWYAKVNGIFDNKYAKSVASKVSGYRLKLGVIDMFFEKGTLASMIYNSGKSIYDEDTLRVKSGFKVEDYRTWANAMVKDIYDNAKTNVEKGQDPNGNTGWRVR